MVLLSRPRRGGMRLRGSSATYAAKVLALPTLGGYWRLNEASGTQAADSSGHGYHGTYTNGPTLANVTGAGATMGLAPTFDGVNDHIVLPHASMQAAWNGDEGAFCGWYKRTGTSGVPVYFIIAAGSTSAFDFYDVTASLVLERKINSSSTNTSAGSVSAGVWTHWGYVWSKLNNYVRLYKDGTQVASLTFGATSWVGSLTAAVIGANVSGGANPYPGSIQDVVWLTSADIAGVQSLAAAS